MNEKKMAYPSGMEKHGNCWRIKKRTPVALQAHYPGQQWHRFSTDEPDKKAAAALILRWQADLEEEFERLRLTGNKFRQAIAPDEIAHLVALMVHSSLSADEESRDAGDYEDDEAFAVALGRLGDVESETRKALSQRIYSGDLPAIVKDWLRGFGYDIPAESDTFKSICLEFAKGRLAAVKARRSRNAGEWVDTPPTPTIDARAGNPPSSTKTVASLTDWFLSRQDQTTPMYRKHKQALGLFKEVFGSWGMDSLRQADIEDFCALLCKLPPHWTKERKTAQRFFRSLLVVFMAPAFDDHLSMAQAGEPVFVQTFIAETPIKRFDIGILIRFAWLNEKELNATGMRPGQHGPATELLAVIHPNRLGQASCLGQLIERPGQLHATDGAFRNNRDRFMSCIVHNGQAFDDSPFRRSVEHEIHRPELIGGRRVLERVTIRQRNLFPLSPSHLQTGLSIEPIHPLVIHHHASLPQLQIDHPGPVAPMTLGERDDPLLQSNIAICRRPITE